MKAMKFSGIIILFFITNVLFAQNIEIYNPEADAKTDISAAVKKASKEGKHVFLQIGGNWCPWCVKFHRFVDGDLEIKKFVEDNFEVVKVNYDQKNKNEAVLSELGFPQRFGFPVFVILDGKGNRIHTQNSAYLEKDKSYNRELVLQFFKHWSPTAVDPNSYKK
jgi:thioredoxin-related protein